MADSAEPIAAVAADLAAGRVSTLIPDAALNAACLEGAAAAVVVDTTPVYSSLSARDRPVYVYEDHPCITQPWPVALFTYVNEHGNVIAMLAHSTVIPRRKRKPRWETQNEVDWGRVRWVNDVAVFAGGRDGTGRPVPTSGPLHMWRFAVYDGGEPADLRWVQLLPGKPVDEWDMAHLTVLASLNFVNCSNCDVIEPARPRGTRRRLADTGVTVKTIHVFPPGPMRRAAGPRPEPSGVPLTSVRGNFATYGQDGRGLLFGKYAGRFWRPQHARGDTAYGERQAAGYRLNP